MCYNLTTILSIKRWCVRIIIKKILTNSMNGVSFLQALPMDIISHILSFTPIRDQKFDTVITELNNFFETDAYVKMRITNINLELLKIQLLYTKYVIFTFKDQTKAINRAKRSTKLIDEHRTEGPELLELFNYLIDCSVAYQNNIVHTDHSYKKPEVLIHIKKRDVDDLRRLEKEK